MKKLLNFFNSRTGILVRTALFLVIGFTTAYFLVQWWNNQPPEKEEIRIGFTWISPVADQNGDPWGVVLEETNTLRVIYTTGMTVVQNKQEPESEPYMFSGGRWFFRTTPGRLFKVKVVEGNSVVSTFDDIMVVRNDNESCLKQGQCPAGAVYLLDVNLKMFTVQTSARQYVVVNP